MLSEFALELIKEIVVEAERLPDEGGGEMKRRIKALADALLKECSGGDSAEC